MCTPPDPWFRERRYMLLNTCSGLGAVSAWGSLLGTSSAEVWLMEEPRKFYKGFILTFPSCTRPRATKPQPRLQRRAVRICRIALPDPHGPALTREASSRDLPWLRRPNSLGGRLGWWPSCASSGGSGVGGGGGRRGSGERSRR